MATYIALGNFTDQGIRGIKDTGKRAQAIKELGQKFGVTMKEIYWTLGPYDVITILEADDDQAATAFGLSIAAMGNVRTQTLRAYGPAEMGAILARLA